MGTRTWVVINSVIGRNSYNIWTNHDVNGNEHDVADHGMSIQSDDCTGLFISFNAKPDRLEGDFSDGIQIT